MCVVTERREASMFFWVSSVFHLATTPWMRLWDSVACHKETVGLPCSINFGRSTTFGKICYCEAPD